MTDPDGITELLISWQSGNEEAFEKLLPTVESELRRIARLQMRRERSDHTLQTTALINEAYLRLVGANAVDWQNRAHFFAICAKIMRRILLNHARDGQAEKRGGGANHLPLDEVIVLKPEKSRELIALDEALQELAEFDQVKSRIVEMRYFGGMTLEETAAALNISTSTVSLQWRLARAWLREQMTT